MSPSLWTQMHCVWRIAADLRRPLLTEELPPVTLLLHGLLNVFFQMRDPTSEQYLGARLRFETAVMQYAQILVAMLKGVLKYFGDGVHAEEEQDVEQCG